MTPWGNVFTTVGLAGVLCVALAYLARSLVTHMLGLQLESHRDALRLQHDTEIERFKAELQIAAKQDEIHYTRLQERRWTVSAQLYSLLVQCLAAVRDFVDPYFDGAQVPSTTLQERAHLSTSELRQYFEENRIWLSGDIANAIEDFLVSVSNAVSLRGTTYPSTGDAKALTAGWEEVDGRAESIRREIEGGFRSMLSIDTD